MNEGIHLDLDTWIVPGQIRKANLCRGLGNRYTPAGTEVLISAILLLLISYYGTIILIIFSNTTFKPYAFSNAWDLEMHMQAELLIR